MRKTAALGGVAALVLASSWLRIERLGTDLIDVLVWALLIGVVPALLPTRPLRLAAVAVAVPVATSEALGTASPVRAVDRFRTGFLTYYDVGLPFSPHAQPLMHGLLLIAVFAFTLLVSLAVAERRAVLAAGLLIAGGAWPATLLPSSNSFGFGAVLLVAALAILAGHATTLRLRQAAVAAAIVVAAAVGLAGVPAVAKGAFLQWQTWDPYTKPHTPVNVAFVWDSTYLPLTWPKKRTTVFTVKAPPVSRYWRATTLDTFSGDVWLTNTHPILYAPADDPLEPAAARDRSKLYRAEITIEALQDQHFIGASVPMEFETDLEPVWYQDTGTVIAPKGIPRGTTYTAWSYVPRPSPEALVRSRPSYSRLLDPYRVVQTRTSTPPMPAFASSRREQQVATIFDENPLLGQYRPLYDTARRVVGNTRNPYAAAVALENWFRAAGGFVYDQSPPQSSRRPALVDFVTRHRRGYCQHFAGAMALMLRYLGIPARVGAGFTSGKYDARSGEWTVTDHDAHTWVEVWFRGYGWLPFDPTPGRGELDGSYSSASVNFNPALIAAALAAGVEPGDFKLEQGRFERGDEPRNLGGRDVPGDVSAQAGRGQGSLLRLLFLVAVALVLGIALLKLALRRARFVTRDPRRVAAACRRELADYLADQRVRVPESATSSELGEVLRHEAGVDPRAFVAAVDAARFGAPAAAGGHARVARTELRRLLAAIRRGLSPWERARGLLSLRSLGVT